LQDYTYRLQGENVTLVRKSGVSMSDILPTELSHSEHSFLAPSMDPQCVSNDYFSSLLNNLFCGSHIGIINSYHFGVKGAATASLDNNPLLKAFLNMIPRNQDHQQVDTNVMRAAAAQYSVNFAKMTNKGRRLYAILDRLLLILLKVHLAPIREGERRVIIAKMKQSKPVGESKYTIASKSYNSKRRIFAKESQRQSYYMKKAQENLGQLAKWDRKVKQSKKRAFIWLANLNKR
jgi:hypothetical protein